MEKDLAATRDKVTNLKKITSEEHNQQKNKKTESSFKRKGGTIKESNSKNRKITTIQEYEEAAEQAQEAER